LTLANSNIILLYIKNVHRKYLVSIPKQYLKIYRQLYYIIYIDI
jgi:hypothetical protein